jgi:hypothetical protein
LKYLLTVLFFYSGNPEPEIMTLPTVMSMEQCYEQGMRWQEIYEDTASGARTIERVITGCNGYSQNEQQKIISGFLSPLP